MKKFSFFNAQQRQTAERIIAAIVFIGLVILIMIWLVTGAMRTP